MRLIRIFSLLLLLSVPTTNGLSATKAIRFGKLVDGSGKVLTNAIVVVEEDRIKSVGTSESAIPANAEVIDMSRYTAIPGLIDVHTHLAGGAGAPSIRAPQQPPPPPQNAIIGMFNGQRAAH